MISREMRSAFNLAFVDSEPRSSQNLRDVLNEAGYRCLDPVTVEQLRERVEVTPPHMIVLRFGDPAHPLVKTIAELRGLLPETLFFLVGSALDLARPQLQPVIEKFLYDVVAVPMLSQSTVVRAFDRAVELDYQIYLNEHLSESHREMSAKLAVRAGPDMAVWAQKLFQLRSADECLDHFMGLLPEEPATLFLRYIPARRVLVGRQARGFAPGQFENRGVDLTREVFSEGIEAFLGQSKNSILNEFVDLEFKWASGCQSRTLTVRDGVYGVFLRSGDLDHPFSDSSIWSQAFDLMKARLETLELENQLQGHFPIDLESGVFNSRHFHEILREEVARARRLNLPASLLVLEIDRAESLRSRLGQADWHQLIRFVARICSQQSRATDRVGRLDATRLAIVLPHTDHPGGLVMAERLRQILSLTSFKKFIPDLDHISVSVGCSSFPNYADECEDWLESADQCLFEASRDGGNRVRGPRLILPDGISQSVAMDV